MRYRLSVFSAPTEEPVLLRDATSFLKIEPNVEDKFISSLIKTARIKAESYTRRAFITQTFDMFMSNAPSNNRGNWKPGYYELPYNYFDQLVPYIEIPKAPLQEIVHIKSYDNADNATVFATSNYQVSAYDGDFAQAGRVTLRNGASWPVPTRNMDGIEVRFKAGYGNSLSVPEPIKNAILNEVLYIYEKGSCQDMGSDVARALLEPYRLMRL